MKVRASIKSCIFFSFFFSHHGAVTETVAVVIPGCFIAGSFHKSADERQQIFECLHDMSSPPYAALEFLLSLALQLHVDRV